MQNLSEEDFKQKYLKYKTKYLNLKGGKMSMSFGSKSKSKSSGSNSRSNSHSSTSVKITDRNEALAEVTKNGSHLKNVSDELKKDRDIVLTAIKQNSEAFIYADNELKKDKEIVLEAITNYNKYSLLNGNKLMYVDETLKDDKDIVLAAVKLDNREFGYASERLKNDKDILFEIIKKDNSKFENLIYNNKSLLADSEYIIKIMKEIPNIFEVYKYEPFTKELRNDKDLANKLPDQKLVDMKSKYSNEIKVLYDETINLKCDSLINTTTCRTFTKNIKLVDDKINELKQNIQNWNKLFLSKNISEYLEELKVKQSNCGCLTGI